MYWGGASSLWNVPLGGPQALWESGQEAWENGLGLRSVTPGKPPTRGLASGLLGGARVEAKPEDLQHSWMRGSPCPTLSKGSGQTERELGAPMGERTEELP